MKDKIIIIINALFYIAFHIMNMVQTVQIKLLFKKMRKLIIIVSKKKKKHNIRNTQNKSENNFCDWMLPPYINSNFQQCQYSSLSTNSVLIELYRIQWNFHKQQILTLTQSLLVFKDGFTVGKFTLVSESQLAGQSQTWGESIS